MIAITSEPLAPTRDVQERRLSEELIPGGTMNAAFTRSRHTIIVEDHPVARAHAESMRASFFAEAEILTGAEALGADLAGRTLIVYVTPSDPWFAAHADRLPFRYGENSVTAARAYEGEHLRFLCAVKSPADPEERAVLYTAARPEDLREINGLFHGPTEWLVADGSKTLDSGGWVLSGALPAEAVRRDFDALVEQILAVHPATYDGRPAAFERALAAARRELGRPMPREELWFLLNRVIASLGDAHSGLMSAVPGDTLDLPLRWLDDGLCVDEDTELLRFGDRVVSIAGRDPSDLLDAVRPIVPAESEVWTRVRAADCLRDATVLRHLGIADAPPLAVVVERDGEQHGVAVPRGATPSRPRASAGRPWVGWRVDREHELALFVLDKCRTDETYAEALNAFFHEVHESGVSRVVVDLRQNSGGNSQVVNDFLRYVDVEEFVDYAGVVRVSEASTAQRGDYGLGPGLHSYAPRVKVNERHTTPPPFDGELVVLVSPRTFSSGNWFAVVLADNDLATIVGQATGNAPSAYGDILSFTLQESGFSFTLSHKQFMRPDGSRDPATELQPDVVVPVTARDLVEGRDPVMEYLLGE